MAGMTDKFIMRPKTSQDVTTSGVSATHTNAFGAQTHVVRLACTAAARYRVGPGTGDTAVATDTLLNPDQGPELIQVRPGEKIYAIQEAAGGKLNVTEMTS